MEEVSGVQWLNQAEFIGHCITVLGQSRAEAEAYWARELRDSSRQRRGTGQGLRLAVQTAPRTEVRAGVEVSRAFVGQAAVDLSGRDEERRLGQLQAALTPAALPDISDDAFAAVDRAALRFGAASSASGPSDPLAQLTAGTVGSTSLRGVTGQPTELQAILAPSTPPAMCLTASASDPDTGATAAVSKQEALVLARP